MPATTLPEPNRRVAPEGQIKVIEVLNAFDPTDHEARFVDWREGLVLADVVPPMLNPETTVASISGEIVERPDWSTRQIRDTDTVVIVSVPGGGGNGSDNTKAVLRLVAVVAISIFAPYAAAGIAGATSGFVYNAAVMGITVAGAVLVNSLLPPQVPEEERTDSPTYGIDGAKNTSEEGMPVPVCYGKFRVGGNIIQMHTENLSDGRQVLYILLNVGEGPVAGITNVELNEQPIENFENFDVYTREGSSNQPVIPWFGFTSNAISKGTTLGTDWIAHTGVNVIDRFRLDFVAPAGIYRFDSAGARRTTDVGLEVQYRLAGTSDDWTPVVDHGSVAGTVFKYNYNATYAGTGVYRELIASAEVRNSLIAGDRLTDGVIIEREFMDVWYVVGYVSIEPQYSFGEMTLWRDTTSPVRWSITGQNLPQGTYEVRVRRQRGEGSFAGGSTQGSDTVIWSDYVEIINDTVAYRNTALLGLRILVDDQLSAIPTITCLNHGIVVQQYVRSPDTGAYTWIVGSTTNPAWIVYDILTNARYGAGRPHSRIDLDKFVEWAEYCQTNNLTCEINFDQSGSLWDQLQYVFRCGHARPLTIGTRYSVAIEKPGTPQMMFNNSNILRDSFTQNWIGIGGRANEIEVSYFDRNDRYKKRTIKYYDETVALDAPQNTASMTLYGVTHPEQALKEAIFQLKLNKYIYSTISFRAFLDAIACSVGENILVQHDQPNWSFGGRVRPGSTTTNVVLDREIEIKTGEDVRLLVHYPALARATGTITAISGSRLTLSSFDGVTPVDRLVSGAGVDVRVTSTAPSSVRVDDASGLSVGNAFTLYKTDAIETRTVTSPVGFHSSVTLSSALPQAPAEFASFLLGPVEEVTREWRITAIEGDGDHERTIRCVNYDERVYDLESGIGEPVDPSYSYTRAIPHVTDLVITESRAMVYGNYRPLIDVSWRRPENFGEYEGAEIYIRTDNGPWRHAQSVRGSASATQLDSNFQVGEAVSVRVVTRATGERYALRSMAPSATITINGDSTAPAAPTNVALIVSPVGLLLSWENPPDPDFDGLEIYRNTVDDFETAELVYRTGHNQISWLDAQAVDPTETYYYAVRAVDYSFNASALVQPTPESASPLSVVNGADAVVGYLTNESHIVPTDASGTPISGAFNGAIGEFRVFEGLLEVTGAASFSLVGSTGASGSIDADGNYAVTAMTADAASVTLRAVYDGAAIDKVFSLAKSRAGQDGSGANAATITLVASAQTFTFDASTGTAVPFPSVQTVNFNANRQNIASAVTWTAYDDSGALVSPSPLSSVSGDHAELTVAAFSSRSMIRVRATAGGLFDETTIVRVQSGVDGDPGDDALSAYLTKDAHVLPASSNGVVSSYTGASGTFKVFDGLTDVTTSATFSVVAGGALTAMIGASTGVYAVTAIPNDIDVGTVTLRAVYNGVTLDRVFTVTKARAGESALSVAELVIYRRDTSTPSTPTGGSYNFSTQSLMAPAGWNSGIPAGSSPVYASRGVAAITGSTGSDNTITWSAPVLVFQDGQSVDIIFTRSASLPSTPSPSSGTPSGWSSNVSTAPGSGLLWSSVGTRSSTSSNYTWQTPIQVEGQAGVDGDDGQPGPALFTLVPRVYAILLTPNSVQQSGGVVAWDSDAYTVESYTGGAFVSGRIPAAGHNAMVGLATDPASTTSYSNINYAWHPSSDGSVHIYLSGAHSGQVFTYSAGDVFSVSYDNQNVMFYQNGILRWSLSAGSGLRLFGKIALASPGASVTHIAFGPAGARGANGDPGAPGSPGANALTISAVPDALTIQCDAGGVPINGQLPRGISIVTYSGTTNVSSVASYSFAFSGCTATDLGGGNITLDTVSAESGYIQVQVNHGGAAVVKRITFAKVRGGASASSQRTTIVGMSSSTSYGGAQAGPLTIPVGPGGLVTCSVNQDYTVSVATGRLAGKFQYRTTPGSGVWIDIDTESLGFISAPGEPGALSFSRQIAGPGSPANWEFQFLNRRVTGAPGLGPDIDEFLVYFNS